MLLGNIEDNDQIWIYLFLCKINQDQRTEIISKVESMLKHLFSGFKNLIQNIVHFSHVLSSFGLYSTILSLKDASNAEIIGLPIAIIIGFLLDIGWTRYVTIKRKKRDLEKNKIRKQDPTETPINDVEES